MRWALKLQPFRFRIEAIPGVDNVGADWLSRSARVGNATFFNLIFFFSLFFCVRVNRMCKYVIIRFLSNRSKFLKRGVMS